MVEVTETMYVNDLTMKWLKNSGRDMIMCMATDMSCDIISEASNDYFSIEILLCREGKCSDNNRRCENLCPKRMVIPSDKIEYTIRWHGFECAREILDFLEVVCRDEGISRIFNKNMILRKGLLELLGESKKKKSKKDTYLTANCGHGVDIERWLEKDEIPVVGDRKISSRKGKKKNSRKRISVKREVAKEIKRAEDVKKRIE